MAFYVGQRVRAGSLPATVLQVYAQIEAAKVRTDSGHEVTYDFSMLSAANERGPEPEPQSKARAGAKNKARAPGEDKAS